MPTQPLTKKSLSRHQKHETTSSDEDEAPEMVQSSKAKLAVAALAEQELRKQSVRDKKLKKLTKKSEKRKHSEEQEDVVDAEALHDTTSSSTKKKKLLDTAVLDFLVQQDEKQEAALESLASTKTPQIQATLETAAPKKSRSKRFVDLKLEATLAKEKVDPFTVKTEVDPAVLKFLHLEFYKKNHRKDTAKFVDAKRSTVVPASDFFGKQRWLTEQVFLNPYDLQH
ncbi:hypothetical protein C9374_010790 [Naegleria lovaniensis]|uniref:Uncharacterized protein n=1 Tax=Naegleria lovaniensis TaxID=51637 RepID=A0AA88GI11_NAELO|nr:uncharacterized protein C9374_010790 [Naegleria lovaniensis]KAG2374506.1 hypothetical protein C9374_010790 [Naegleria lovaniensis]